MRLLCAYFFFLMSSLKMLLRTVFIGKWKTLITCVHKEVGSIKFQCERQSLWQWTLRKNYYFLFIGCIQCKRPSSYLLQKCNFCHENQFVWKDHCFYHRDNRKIIYHMPKLTETPRSLRSRFSNWISFRMLIWLSSKNCVLSLQMIWYDVKYSGTYCQGPTDLPVLAWNLRSN